MVTVTLRGSAVVLESVAHMSATPPRVQEHMSYLIKPNRVLCVYCLEITEVEKKVIVTLRVIVNLAELRSVILRMLS